MPTLNGVFYAERGHGPPLVCVHGAGGAHGHWAGLFAGLAPAARAIAVDLPGHGRSAPPAHATIAAYAAALAAFLDDLGAGPALLAGHSMGAAVALELAVARPDLARGLALVGAGARLRVAPAILAGLAADPPAAVAQLVEWMFPRPPPPSAAPPRPSTCGTRRRSAATSGPATAGISAGGWRASACPPSSSAATPT
jgi:pimeloyl-ACP methyl ester carboxylesterase